MVRSALPDARSPPNRPVIYGTIRTYSVPCLPPSERPVPCRQTMAGVAPDSRGSAAADRGGTLTRADAMVSRERILEAATTLAGDRRVSMAQIAAAAGVGRSTLYRHFPTR